MLIGTRDPRPAYKHPLHTNKAFEYFNIMRKYVALYYIEMGFKCCHDNSTYIKIKSCSFFLAFYLFTFIYFHFYHLTYFFNLENGNVLQDVFSTIWIISYTG